MPQDVEISESSPESPEIEEVSLESLSAEQYNSWRLDGKLPEAKPETPPPSKETVEAAPKGEVPKGKQEVGKGVKERIPQLDSEIQELETRLARKAELKRQLEEPGDKATAPPVQTKPELKEPIEPDQDHFKTWDEFEKANRQYQKDLRAYDKAVLEQTIEAKWAEKSKQQQQEAEGKTAAERWNKQVESEAKEHSDWNDKVAGVTDLVGKDPRFQAGASFLLDSEIGAKILYHLGDNPDLAKDIAAMTPIKQIAALTRIEDSLTKPSQSATEKKAPPVPKKHPEAPPPPSDLNGRNQLAPDPVAAAIEADDTEAYIREMNAKDVADIAAGKRRSYR